MGLRDEEEEMDATCEPRVRLSVPRRIHGLNSTTCSLHLRATLITRRVLVCAWVARVTILLLGVLCFSLT